jgi:serine/threonine protein kinase
VPKTDFGRWEIVRSLGEGGQAHTFVVRDKGNEAPGEFVLKRLKNDQRIGRFRVEIEAGLALSHPNLVRVIEADLEAKSPYLVTEFCKGGPLSKHATSEKPLLAILRTFLAICQGVAQAHGRGITHRDLKPENVFLREDGSPAVGDFGLCYIDGGERFTLLEEAVGSVNFIDPELEAGRAEQVRPCSDVYSLGKLLYWMLAGRSIPREKHREGDFDLTRTRRDPAWFIVYELLDRMIVADPAKRFNNAGEVVSALESVIHRIERNAHAISRDAPQPCSYCGVGCYKLIVEYEVNVIPGWGGAREYERKGDETFKEFFGMEPKGPYWLIMVCDHCGHVQMFRPEFATNPNIWKRKDEKKT